jgi:hypothetical protein
LKKKKAIEIKKKTRSGPLIDWWTVCVALSRRQDSTSISGRHGTKWKREADNNRKKNKEKKGGKTGGTVPSNHETIHSIVTNLLNSGGNNEEESSSAIYSSISRR